MKYKDFIALLKANGYTLVRDSLNDYVMTDGYEIAIGPAYIYSNPDHEIDLSNGAICVNYQKVYKYKSFVELCELLDRYRAKK